MKITSTFTAAMIGLAVASNGATGDSPNSQLQGYPKNLARQHLGSNLSIFDAANQEYKPTEAAAAWLDDDVSTGWPPLAGKSYYLLSLPEADLLTDFMISAKASSGRISLYAGDELAPPDAQSWSPIATDLDLAAVNGKRMDKRFSRFAKYILIETDITEAGPWYSLNTYGDRAAASYRLEKRNVPIDLGAVFGPYTNDQTAFNFAGVYTGARVSSAKALGGEVGWQKAIDDNPQTSISVAPSADEASLVVSLGETTGIQRIALLTEGSAEGRLDFFLVESGSDSAATAGVVDIAGLTPTATMILDGSTPRSSIDFPSSRAEYLAVRWTPSDGTGALALSELNAFSDASLATYALTTELPAAVAERDSGAVAERDSGDEVASGGDYDDGKTLLGDGKTFLGDGKTVLADYGGGKTVLPPAVGEFLPAKNPFVPAGLGFPTNLNNIGLAGPTAVSDPQPIDTPASP